MPMHWRDYSVSTPEILQGKQRIKGTGIPINFLLGYLTAGHTIDNIIAEFPDVRAIQIQACLDYARELSGI